MQLEEAGVPVATIVTEQFRRLAELEARYLGAPSLPLVVVPHPVGGQPEQRVREVARNAVSAVERVFLTPVPLLEQRGPA